MGLFEFVKVSKRYHYEKFDVIKDFDLSIGEGETHTVMLEVQSGKSTLAKLLTGVIKPTQGEMCFKGESYSFSTHDKGIMYVGEEPLYFKNRSVYFNLAYPLKIRKCSNTEIGKEINRINADYNLDLEKKAKNLTPKELCSLLCARGETRKISLLVLDGVKGECFERLCAFAEKKKCALLILTGDIAQAKGRVTVVQNKEIIYRGDAGGAAQTIQNTLWLT